MARLAALPCGIRARSRRLPSSLQRNRMPVLHVSRRSSFSPRLATAAAAVAAAGAGRLRQEATAAPAAGARRGARRRPKSAWSRRHAGRRRPGDRTAGPARGLARGAGARPRRRHRAEAPVPRRQRREGRPAAVPDRPGALRGRRAAAPQASLARAEANLAQATALAERYKPLVEANAVSKQEYANAVAAAEDGRGRRGRRPRRRADRQDQPRLRHRHGADLRPHRPRAGDRRRAGGPGRGDASWP